MTDPHEDLAPETAREVRFRIVQQLPLMVILVVLWMLLWGAISWLNLVTGVVLAIVVVRVFYLPSVELTWRFDPFAFAVFFGHFVVELVVASVQVAYLSFRGVERNSVIAVQLSSRSDLMTTLTAIAIALLPGSIVVEVDRDRSILYLHVLNTPDQARADRAHRAVLAVERRIVRALGSRDDLRRLAG